MPFTNQRTATAEESKLRVSNLQSRALLGRTVRHATSFNAASAYHTERMTTDLRTRIDAARPKLAASASTIITLPFLAILGLSAGWPLFVGTLVLAVAGVLLSAAAP